MTYFLDCEGFIDGRIDSELRQFELNSKTMPWLLTNFHKQTIGFLSFLRCARGQAWVERRVSASRFFAKPQNDNFNTENYTPLETTWSRTGFCGWIRPLIGVAPKKGFANNWHYHMHTTKPFFLHASLRFSTFKFPSSISESIEPMIPLSKIENQWILIRG